jgi:hypothetical protein
MLASPRDRDTGPAVKKKKTSCSPSQSQTGLYNIIMCTFLIRLRIIHNFHRNSYKQALCSGWRSNITFPLMNFVKYYAWFNHVAFIVQLNVKMKFPLGKRRCFMATRSC